MRSLCGIGYRYRVVPWQGYASQTDIDLDTKVADFLSINPITSPVPKEIRRNDRVTNPFVSFGVYANTE